MRSFRVALLLILAGSGARAQLWDLGNCPLEFADKRSSFRQQLLKAAPGDRMYVPHPYPDSDAEVVENFLYQHRRAWSAMASGELPPEEKRLFAAVDAGRASFDLTRVANWTPIRCGWIGERRFYYLIRIVDQETGAEITRAAVAEEGDVAQVIHRPVKQELALPELPSRSDLGRFARHLSHLPSSSQYVTAWGTLRCDLLRPCVAFRSGIETYLVHEEHLYRLATERAPYSVREKMPTAPDRARFLASFRGRQEKLISLGGDLLGTALPVQP